jgi:hypothetical protein
LNISGKMSTAANLEATDEIASEISDIRSSSRSRLDSLTREFMEVRFHHDFRNARVHATRRQLNQQGLWVH